MEGLPVPKRAFLDASEPVARKTGPIDMSGVDMFPLVESPHVLRPGTFIGARECVIHNRFYHDGIVLRKVSEIQKDISSV